MARNVLINPKQHSICISFNDSNPLYYFDPKGRLIGAYVEGRNFKRGLDDRLHQQWGVWEHGVKRRCRNDLAESEKQAFFARMSQDITPVYRALLEGRQQGIQILTRRAEDALPEKLLNWLAKIVAFDAAARKQDRDTFRSIYKPVTILPPDQYLSVVLQATEGCVYNQCTFCDFYKGRPFHIKSEAEFQAHIDAVKAFFGESMRLRKSIFLADANALTIPQDKLLCILEQVHAAFDIVPDTSGVELAAWKAAHPVHFNGIYSFIDAFSTRKRVALDFATLHRWHFQRVYIGVETGNAELLRFLRKPGTPELMCEAVHTIKAGGMHVGVILLIGIGGEDYFDAHVEDTVALMHEMNLSRGDIIYFSEFVAHVGLEYSQRAAEAGIQPLTPERMQAQMQAMKDGLQFTGKNTAPQLSIYDIREFIY
jgi:radical SAM superfamily enzyme YgiQ (UPF0313 family)